MLLSGIPIALLINQLGSKYSMITGACLAVAANLIISSANHYLQIGIGTLLFGAGAGSWILARIHYVTETIPLSHRGRAMATMMAVERCGWIIGPLLAGVLIQYLQHSAAFIFSATSATLALLLVTLFGPTHQPRYKKNSENQIANVLSMAKKYRHVFLNAGIVVTVLQLLRSTRSFIIPIWGITIGIDETAIGSLIFFSALLELVMFYPAGQLLDKHSRKASGLPCLLLFSLGFLLLPLTSLYWQLLAVAFVTSIGNGLGTGFVMTLGADFAPTNKRATFLGLWRIVGDAGNLSGPIITGFVAGALSLAGASLAIGGIGMLGGWWLLAKVPNPCREKNVTQPSVSTKGCDLNK